MKETDKGKRDSVRYGTCRTADEFWIITRAEYEPGEISEFPDDEVIRFVEKIVTGIFFLTE